MIEARNFAYMFYGFAAAWTILIIYVITLGVRERRINRELTRLKSLMEDRERTR